MGLKNWRAVFEYKQGLIRGAGACFAIGEDEADARAQIEQAMPGVTITQIREEQEDPRAVYERRPVLSVVRAENLPAAELEQKVPACNCMEHWHGAQEFDEHAPECVSGLGKKPPACEGCGELLVAKAELERGWCDGCEKRRHQDEADARGHG